MDERGADAGVVSNYQLRELDMSSDQQQSRWMRLGGTCRYVAGMDNCVTLMCQKTTVQSVASTLQTDPSA
jgi:hypothetical protein